MTSVAALQQIYAASKDPSPQAKVNAGNLDSQTLAIIAGINALNTAVSQFLRDDNTPMDASVPLRALTADILTMIASRSGWIPLAGVACATTGSNITLSGEQTIDGVTTNLSRVLVKDQSNPAQNLIYLSGPGAWTPVTDAPLGSDIGLHMVAVRGGTVNFGKSFIVLNLPGSATVGTSAITWEQAGSAGGLAALINGGTGVSSPSAWPTSRRLMCRVVATTQITVASPGTTIDGVNLAPGDRALLTAQGTASENGPWVFTSSSTPMTRPPDYPSYGTAQAYQDVEIPIREGSAYASTAWRLATSGAITIDVTSTTWSMELCSPMVIDSIAVLRTIAGAPTTVYVRGYYSPGDGGGGTFLWNATDSTSDNGGTVIAPNAGGTGRWNRIYEPGEINVRWFGAYGDNVHDDTTALNHAAAAAAGGVLFFPAGVYITGGLSITNANAGLRLQGADYFHYNSTTSTSIVARDNAQSAVITIASNTNQIAFRGLRIDGLSKAAIGVQANNAAFLTMQDCGVYATTSYGLICTGGVGRFDRVFFSNAGVGLQIYSDTTVTNSEFTGGTIPLSVTAGGCRLVNVWANGGSTCCVQLQPLTNATNHINTAIVGCYFGETIGTAGQPIISILQNGSASVQYVQITGGYHVNADTSVNRKIGWLNATDVTGLTITGVQFQGYGTYLDSNHITQYWLNLTNCSQVNVSGCVVYGCNANPVLCTGCAQVSIIGNQFINWGDGGSSILNSGQKICITTATTNKLGVGGNLFSVTTGDSGCTALLVDNGNTFYSPGINFIDYPSGTVDSFTANPGQLLWTRGNQGPMHLSGLGIVQDAAGMMLTVKEGSSASVQGTATLVGGTVAISFPAATSQSRIYLQVITPGGTQGFLHYSVTPGTGFTVTSSSGSDTSTISYLIIQGS